MRQRADTDRVDTIAADAPRYSRKWFGGIFFACWGCLVLLGLALDTFRWHREGALYWLIAGPLLVGVVAAGIPWLGLSTRDLYRNRQRLWMRAREMYGRRQHYWLEARPWLLPIGAVLAVFAAAAGLDWLGH